MKDLVVLGAQLASAARVAVALVIFLTIQLVGPTPSGATTVVFHDFTYDHRVWSPSAAQRCGENGLAALAIEVDRNGFVSEARVTKTSGFADLDVAAQQAVLGWRYRATQDGSAKPFPHEAKVVFSSGDHAPPYKGECSKIAIMARAKAMIEAPRVNPALMPRGMEPPKFAGVVRSEVDLGATRSVVCGPTATTHEYAVTIGVDGSVSSTDTDELWGSPALDQAAVRLVKSLRFDPARSKGRNIQVSILVFVTPRPLGVTTCVLQAE